MRRSWRAMTAIAYTSNRRALSIPPPARPSTDAQHANDALLAQTLERVRQEGTLHGANLVAYSGGVDSSLVAALVQRAFPTNSIACIGLSASLPAAQLTLAREVAAYIGITLKEVTTHEGEAPEYVANRGLSCFHCKTHLYTALRAVAAEAHTQHTAAAAPVTLFNGTNAEDRQDPTRVGLKAAHNFQVRSPIDHLTKQQVRALAQTLGLPNWQHAASPCLRSRLALGVPAVEEHMRKVEAAEGVVRTTLGTAGVLDVRHNVRVRLLAQGKAMIEVDEELLAPAASYLVAMEGCMKEELGFAAVSLRAFKSGSVNGLGGVKKKKEGAEEDEKGRGTSVVVNSSRDGQEDAGAAVL